MTNKLYSIPEIKDLLMPVIYQYKVKRAVLFGSYSKNSATEKSDVDLLVYSGFKGLQFVGLSEDIRQALDKDVDIFDVTHIELSSLIDNEIKNTGVIFYEK